MHVQLCCKLVAGHPTGIYCSPAVPGFAMMLFYMVSSLIFIQNLTPDSSTVP